MLLKKKKNLFQSFKVQKNMIKYDICNWKSTSYLQNTNLSAISGMIKWIAFLWSEKVRTNFILSIVKMNYINTSQTYVCTF
jgi:hypothetical protein